VKLLKSFEFDSARKRMSVIIEDDGVYKLLTKVMIKAEKFTYSSNF